MPMRRRHFLRLAGASSAVILAASTAWAMTRTPTRALAPWQAAAAGGDTDPRIAALRYAILAPNSHNRQPWMVDLSQPDTILLKVDPERLLPATDPFNRQIVVSLGCFLEILRMALAEQGLAASIQAFPDGEDAARLDDRPVARIRITPDPAVARDPLFAQVLDRRSCKDPFEDRAVTEALMRTALSAAAAPALCDGTIDPARIRQIADLGFAGHELEVRTPHTLKESIQVMRIGKAEIEATPDGIDIGGEPFLDALAMVGVISRTSLSDPSSSGFAQGLEMYRALFDTARGWVWMWTPGNSRAEQLEAGRDWVRLNLKTTEMGLALHPVSQLLQEYPEMAPLAAQLPALLQVPDGVTVQMLGRIGYGPQTRPSPRWPLEARLVAPA